jgi:hypothetical protein
MISCALASSTSENRPAIRISLAPPIARFPQVTQIAHDWLHWQSPHNRHKQQIGTTPQKVEKFGCSYGGLESLGIWEVSRQALGRDHFLASKIGT